LIGTSDVPTFAAVSDQRLAGSGQQVVAFSQLQLRSIPRLYDMQNSLAVRILRGSLFLIIALISSFLPRLLGLPEYTQQWADVATTLALFMQGVIWANIIIGYYIQRYVRVYATDGSSITTFKALGAVARLTIWIILGLVALSVHGVQVRTLLTGLAIGGLAVALAVQNILGDLFAAIAIVMDKPFVVGDSISVENYRGKVENIGLKTTRVRSESGEQIIFANGELLKSKIRNYSR
jgi:small-conductance mechanosensitive channel